MLGCKYRVTILLVVAVTSSAFSQVYMFSGVQQNFIRSEAMINTSPLTDFHLGGGVNFYLSAQQQKTSFNAEFAFVKKGYHQNVGGRKFNLHFNYITYQATARYSIVDFASIEGGVNLGILVDSNMKKWMNTYYMLDVGLVGGLVFFEHKRIGLYARAVYGLIPMVNYERPDELGNFHTVHDLKNTCFMVGVRFNVYEKKWCFKN